MSVQLNILCLICISHQYPQNCIDNDARVLFNFHLKYSKTRTISKHMVSPDEIQRQERVSVCRSNAEGKKTFLAKR